MVNKVYESKSFSTKIAGVLQWKETENVGTSGKKSATQKKTTERTETSTEKESHKAHLE